MPDLFDFTEKLTGLAPARARAGRERVRELQIPHLDRELVSPETVDAVVASLLLAEGIDALVERGIERTRLVSKLRNDPDVWPTWAELRAADQLGNVLSDDAELALEPDRARGRHADFRAWSPTGRVFGFLPDSGSTHVSIEFKALGLSDQEASFCRRAVPTLRALTPSDGFVTVHAPIKISRDGVWVNRQRRRHMQEEAARLALVLPRHTSGMSGAVVVAHGTEGAYVARLRSRLVEAFAQLPNGHSSWVAFHWSNGAPFRLISEALNSVDRPSNLLGVVLIGSAVAFPYPDIHNFLMWGVVGADGEDIEFRSELDDAVARTVFERIDASTGVRATIVRGSPGGGRQPQPVVLRDGSRRILPYVLLIDRDPDPMSHRAVPI
jgi:hypothetical protein